MQFRAWNTRVHTSYPEHYLSKPRARARVGVRVRVKTGVRPHNVMSLSLKGC